MLFVITNDRERIFFAAVLRILGAKIRVLYAVYNIVPY